MGEPRTAVITIASGRHDHLREQHAGLWRGTALPEDYIVVAIADPDITTVLDPRPPRPRIVDVPTTPTGLPLAHARNTGASVALAADAELLVFLDVDCIPSPDLLSTYKQMGAASDRHLLCGPVAYLPPKPPGLDTQKWCGLATPHPARPAPPFGEVIDAADHTLFWSLSFALTAHTWHAIGGFCEDYTGYGGEDTDFGQRARAAGVGLRWIGGADAFHQYHPVNDPPVEHLADILRNAKIFHRQWGWWPMTGWLTEFERRGLTYYDPQHDQWSLNRSPTRDTA